jgi:hypothetical protein
MDFGASQIGVNQQHLLVVTASKRQISWVRICRPVEMGW